MKKILIGFFLVIGLFLLFYLLLNKPIGRWICQQGNWTKQGDPEYPHPLISCNGRKALPKNEADCLTQGGVWKKIGPDPFPSCNRKTIDRGNLCRDNSECEGNCQITLTREELRQGMSGKLNKTVRFGQCSLWVIELGCQGIMKNGKVQVICLD